MEREGGGGGEGEVGTGRGEGEGGGGEGRGRGGGGGGGPENPNTEGLDNTYVVLCWLARWPGLTPWRAALFLAGLGNVSLPRIHADLRFQFHQNKSCRGWPSPRFIQINQAGFLRAFQGEMGAAPAGLRNADGGVGRQASAQQPCMTWGYQSSKIWGSLGISLRLWSRFFSRV